MNENERYCINREFVGKEEVNYEKPNRPAPQRKAVGGRRENTSEKIKTNVYSLAADRSSLFPHPWQPAD